MKLQHIELSELKVSPVNVRKRGAGEDLGELIASIRSLGVIQPLLVRPNCEGYEVIAGQRRLLEGNTSPPRRLRGASARHRLRTCGALQYGRQGRGLRADARQHGAVNDDWYRTATRRTSAHRHDGQGIRQRRHLFAGRPAPDARPAYGLAGISGREAQGRKRLLR